MKKSKMLRLLTPDDMYELRLAVYDRAQTSCMGLKLREAGHERWALHKCGGRHTGPLTDFSVMDADHIIEQSWLKASLPLDEAREAAKNPDLCIPVCQVLHAAKPRLSTKQLFDLVAENADALEAAAKDLNLFYKLNRLFNYDWEKLMKEREE